MRIQIKLAMVICSLITIKSRALAQEEAQVTTTSEATNHIDLETPVIDRSSRAHVHIQPALKGFWAKKFAWRPRWVKTWQEKKVYVAVWKRMWGPIVLKEWMPVPKPPPGWVKHQDAGSFVVKTFPHH